MGICFGKPLNQIQRAPSIDSNTSGFPPREDYLEREESATEFGVTIRNARPQDPTALVRMSFGEFSSQTEKQYVRKFLKDNPQYVPQLMGTDQQIVETWFQGQRILTKPENKRFKQLSKVFGYERLAKAAQLSLPREEHIYTDPVKMERAKQERLTAYISNSAPGSASNQDQSIHSSSTC